ncbi:MAG: hypothetical protein ABW007_25325 [Chitinophagaceae bacterium]
MKKSLLILSIASFAIISSTHAQIKKGATLIGGNIGGGTSNTDNPNSPYVDQSSLAVGLRFGKAVRENLIVGGIASYSGNKWENANNSPTSSTQRQYSAGFFARKYKPIGSSGFYIFGTGSLAGVLTRNTDTYPQPGTDTKTKATAVNLSVDPGVSYAVNKWLQIEAGLNNLLTLSYQVSTREDLAGTHKTKSFNGNVNVSGQVPLYIGLTVLLN